MKKNQKNLSFLVVDDEPILVQFIVDVLKGMGFDQIDTSNNGENAYSLCTAKMIQENPYDIIISDWRMPLMTGIELLEKIRKNGKLRNTAFVMITAVDDVTQIKQAAQSRVDQYILKPFKAEELEKKLMIIIEKLLRR
ncbi:MAG: response regulator [Bacteriovoracaceae bacterium]|nr:response regulator [Bacteriovoracaceae bacterium]